MLAFSPQSDALFLFRMGIVASGSNLITWFIMNFSNFVINDERQVNHWGIQIHIWSSVRMTNNGLCFTCDSFAYENDSYVNYLHVDHYHITCEINQRLLRDGNENLPIGVRTKKIWLPMEVTRLGMGRKVYGLGLEEEFSWIQITIWWRKEGGREVVEWLLFIFVWS